MLQATASGVTLGSSVVCAAATVGGETVYGYVARPSVADDASGRTGRTRARGNVTAKDGNAVGAECRVLLS